MMILVVVVVVVVLLNYSCLCSLKINISISISITFSANTNILSFLMIMALLNGTHTFPKPKFPIISVNRVGTVCVVPEYTSFTLHIQRWAGGKVFRCALLLEICEVFRKALLYPPYLLDAMGFCYFSLGVYNNVEMNISFTQLSRVKLYKIKIWLYQAFLSR